MNNEKSHKPFCCCSECIDKLISNVVTTPAVKNWRVSFFSGAYVDVQAVNFQVLPISQVIAFIDKNNNSVLQVPIKFAPVITQLY